MTRRATPERGGVLTDRLEMEGYVAEVVARLEREWPQYRRFVLNFLFVYSLPKRPNLKSLHRTTSSRRRRGASIGSSEEAM